VAANLPEVLGDAGALQRALQNLIENAVKYGAGAGWVGVTAEAAAGGGVDLTVLDRGPGLDRADLPHLFEPFFRGRDAAASGVPGSGLGLSLVRHIVESHGGSVVASANPQGTGSAFRIHLPAAPPEADAERAPAGLTRSAGDSETV
jgi:signal transduction histidine kinase